MRWLPNMLVLSAVITMLLIPLALALFKVFVGGSGDWVKLVLVALALVIGVVVQWLVSFFTAQPVNIGDGIVCAVAAMVLVEAAERWKPSATAA